MRRFTAHGALREFLAMCDDPLVEIRLRMSLTLVLRTNDRPPGPIILVLPMDGITYLLTENDFREAIAYVRSMR